MPSLLRLLFRLLPEEVSVDSMWTHLAVDHVGLPGWCGDGIQSTQQMVRTGHNLPQSVPSDSVTFQAINTHSSCNRGSSSRTFYNPEWNAAALNIYCTLPGRGD